jgi:hypothetical protein
VCAYLCDGGLRRAYDLLGLGLQRGRRLHLAPQLGVTARRRRQLVSQRRHQRLGPHAVRPPAPHRSTDATHVMGGTLVSGGFLQYMGVLHSFVELTAEVSVSCPFRTEKTVGGSCSRLLAAQLRGMLRWTLDSQTTTKHTCCFNSRFSISR